MQVRCRSHFRTTGEPHTCVLFSTDAQLSRLGVSEGVFEGTVGPKRASAYSSNDESPALGPGLVIVPRSIEHPLDPFRRGLADRVAPLSRSAVARSNAAPSSAARWERGTRTDGAEDR